VSGSVSEEGSAERICVCTGAQFDLSSEIFEMGDFEIVFRFEKSAIVVVDKCLGVGIRETNGRCIAILVQEREVVVVPVFG
jgi:hypothetical protein